MKKYYCVLIFTGIFCMVQAQQNKAKWKFTSINEMGMLYGENGTSFTMTTINGFRKNTLSAGIGVSIDPYAYTNFPVFADIRKYFGSKSWKTFLYGDAGIGIAFNNSSLPAKWNTGLDAYQLHPSFFGELGFGVEKNIQKNAKFFIQVGYSQKQFSYTLLNENVPLWFNYKAPLNRYDFYYRRIAIKLGLAF